MFLLKNIPSGAGLGGGSSDASFTLKILNDLFDLKISTGQLEEYAAQLGSDCPFFIKNLPVFVKGRGEILEQIDFTLQGKWITIVHPGIHISTKEAFQNITLSKPEIPLLRLIRKPISEWQRSIKNDFEPYAFSQYPVLGEIKKLLIGMGASYVSMSGSGSAIYAISDSKLNSLSQFNEFTVWSGML